MISDDDLAVKLSEELHRQGFEIDNAGDGECLFVWNAGSDDESVCINMVDLAKASKRAIPRSNWTTVDVKIAAGVAVFLSLLSIMLTSPAISGMATGILFVILWKAGELWLNR